MTTRAAILRDMTFSFAGLLAVRAPSRDARTTQMRKADACTRRADSPNRLISTICEESGPDRPGSVVCAGASTVIESREPLPGGRQCVRFRTNGTPGPSSRSRMSNPGAADTPLRSPVKIAMRDGRDSWLEASPCERRVPEALHPGARFVEGGQGGDPTRTERVTAMRAVLTTRLSERSASHASLEELRAHWAAAHTPLRRHRRDVGKLTGPAR